MWWISNNRETNVLVRYTVQTFNVCTQMVLDITRTLPKYTINIQTTAHLQIEWHTSSAASRPANWVKIWESGLRQTLARTFSLPLWGMPMMILSTPRSVLLSMICFIAGINISQPSRPKRFSEDHFLAKKASNLLTKEILLSVFTLLVILEFDSIFF